MRFVLVLTAVAALVAAIAAPPAPADPPPAAAGTTSHGFLVERGVLAPIDHPDATTVPSVPNGQAGTATVGVNDHGEILGLYEGRDRVIRHFVHDRKGRFITIDSPRSRPPGQFDEYADINNRGEIVGFYNDDQGATTTGFLRTRRGRFVDLAVPGSEVTGPLKLNDRRQVVGIYVDADAPPPSPDGSIPSSVLHGFLYHDGDYETIDVPGATATAVLGVNNRGQMVGSYLDTKGAYHGFVRERDGPVTTLPEAPGAEPTAGGTQPVSINDRGRIVGLAYDSRGGSRAFVYERGSFRLFDGARDATYTRATDISNRGQVVGDYGVLPPPAGPLGD